MLHAGAGKRVKGDKAETTPSGNRKRRIQGREVCHTALLGAVQASTFRALGSDQIKIGPTRTVPETEVR